MTIELLYFDGCPHWQVTDERLGAALSLAGLKDVVVRRTRVASFGDAERLRFVGSPTVLVNGHDPFADGNELVGLACRVFETPQGRAGSPTIEQLVEVLS